MFWHFLFPGGMALVCLQDSRPSQMCLKNSKSNQKMGWRRANRSSFDSSQSSQAPPHPHRVLMNRNRYLRRLPTIDSRHFFTVSQAIRHDFDFDIFVRCRYHKSSFGIPPIGTTREELLVKGDIVVIGVGKNHDPLLSWRQLANFH